MIDYIKLKEAHELMLILSNNNGCSLRLTFCDGKFWKYFLQINDKKDIFEFNCIDDLITKLKELTQTKPKYALGDIVWLYDYSINEIQSFKIDAITLKTFKYSGNCIEDGFAYEEIAEKDIYPSRDALIDAQIEYWKGLKQDKVVPVEESQESKICPECGSYLDAYGVCWQTGCSYIKPLKPEDMHPKFEGEVKGFNHCEHDYDALRDDNSYKFSRYINGTSYYVSHKDNGVYCGCGVPADYAHRCKCRKCGAVKITHSRCKKCVEFYNCDKV